MTTANTHSCIECRYYIPNARTFYNKPCGYCGNFRVNKPCVSDDKACKLFERDSKAPKALPP